MPTQNMLRLILLLMLTLRIMLATVCCKFESWGLVIKLNFFRLWFCQDFEVEVQARFEAGIWSVFCCWCFVEVMKLSLGRDPEARFGQYLEFELSRDADGCWYQDWRLVNVLKIRCCVWTCDMTMISYLGNPNSTLGSTVPLAIFWNDLYFRDFFWRILLLQDHRKW